MATELKEIKIKIVPTFVAYQDGKQVDRFECADFEALEKLVDKLEKNEFTAEKTASDDKKEITNN